MKIGDHVKLIDEDISGVILDIVDEEKVVVYWFDGVECAIETQYLTLQ